VSEPDWRQLSEDAPYHARQRRQRFMTQAGERVTRKSSEYPLDRSDGDASQFGARKEHIGRLLRRAARSFDQQFRVRLDELGYQDVGLRHATVFSHLDPEGTRATELASRAGMTRQSMGELVAELVTRGYLAQQSDPTDRRSKIVVLTSAGHRHVHDAREMLAEIHRSWEQRLGAAGVEQLRSLLMELAGPFDTSSEAGEPREADTPI
jgi:DNA-binding MarR family transcriptional regulator